MQVKIKKEGKMGKILDLNQLVKGGIWGRCFQCQAKLKGEERKYGFCERCLTEMGVKNVTS